MAQDVTRHGSRTDDTTPRGQASATTPREKEGGVRQDEDLKNVERLPRLGNEDDMPDSDALGG